MRAGGRTGPESIRDTLDVFAARQVYDNHVMANDEGDELGSPVEVRAGVVREVGAQASVKA